MTKPAPPQQSMKEIRKQIRKLAKQLDKMDEQRNEKRMAAFVGCHFKVENNYSHSPTPSTVYIKALGLNDAHRMLLFRFEVRAPGDYYFDHDIGGYHTMRDWEKISESEFTIAFEATVALLRKDFTAVCKSKPKK